MHDVNLAIFTHSFFWETEGMDQTLTFQIKRAKHYYFFASALWACFFATGNWLFFWRLYLTNGQIGLVDGLCFLVGMLAEIPTGVIADRIGRRKIMIIGAVIMGIGYGSMGFAQHGVAILVGYLTYSIGSAFYAGADDALLYDYLKFHHVEDEWETIVRRRQIITRLTMMAAVFIGGYLYILNVRFPSITRGLFFLLLLYPLLRMKFMDTAQPIYSRDSDAGYFNHLWTGMRELLNRKLLPIVLLVLCVQGVTVSMVISGILRPLLLERTGLPITDHSAYISAVSILAILVLLYKNRVGSGVSLYYQAVIAALIVVGGFVLNLPASSLIGGLVGIALIHVGNYLLVPATSALINAAASSKHRATVLSGVNLLEDIPYVIAAPLIGLGADRGMLTGIVAVLALIMILAVGGSVLLHRKQKNTSFLC